MTPSSDIAPRPPVLVDGPKIEALIHPDTGEVLDLKSAPDEDLAAWLERVREWEGMSRAAKQMVSEELNIRMDGDARWTRRAGGYKITGQAPRPPIVDDPETLRAELEELRDLGLISGAAVDGAVEVVTEHKARRAGLDALEKLGGEVAETVKKHRVPDPKPRSISLSRLGS